MAEHKSKLESVREWVVQNKLRTVGNFLFFLGLTKILNLFIFIIIIIMVMLILLIFVTKGSLWLSGIAGSIAYNWSQPGMKTSVKIIHARYIFLSLSFFLIKKKIF